jgi:hypothetical protein
MQVRLQTGRLTVAKALPEAPTLVQELLQSQANSAASVPDTSCSL